MKPKMKRLQDFRIPNRNPVVIYFQRFQSFMVVWTHFEVHFFLKLPKTHMEPEKCNQKGQKRNPSRYIYILGLRLQKEDMCCLPFKFPSIPNSKYSTTSYVLQQGEDALIGRSLHNSHISSRVVGSPAWDASLDLSSAKSHATLPPKILGLAVFFSPKKSTGKHQR